MTRIGPTEIFCLVSIAILLGIGLLLRFILNSRTIKQKIVVILMGFVFLCAVYFLATGDYLVYKERLIRLGARVASTLIPLVVNNEPASSMTPENTEVPWNLYATQTALIHWSSTPTPVKYACSMISGLNIRSGPGTAYEVVGTLIYRHCALVIGATAKPVWWQTTLGWVYDDYVILLPENDPLLTKVPGTPTPP